MKPIRALSFALLALIPSIASADIGINFVGGAPTGNNGVLGAGGVKAMAADESAGVVPQTHWNNAGSADNDKRFANNTGTIAGALTDEAGNVLKTASVAWHANNCFSINIPDQAGNNRLMRGYLDSEGPADSHYTSSTTTVTITVPDEYAKTGYDVYLYFDGGSTAGKQDRVGRFRLFDGKTNTGKAAKEIYGKDSWKVDFKDKFIEATGSSEKDATAGNYIVFHDVKFATFTLDATGVTADVPRAPINAIQIVRKKEDYKNATPP